MNIVRLSELEPRPWKNGSGITWEIAADQDQPPAWRLSIALIDRSGPFSEYAGYDRTIVSIDGGLVELNVNGARITLRHGEPFAFRGEAVVTCELHGDAARDFNVMTRRDFFSHDVAIIAARDRLALDDGESAFIVILLGDALVGRVPCTAGETICVQSGREPIEIVPEDGALVCLVRIKPV